MSPAERARKVHCLSLSRADAVKLRGVVSQHDLHRLVKSCKLLLHPEPVFLPTILQDAGNEVALFLRDPMVRFPPAFDLALSHADRAGVPGEPPSLLIEFKTPNDLAEALSAANKKTQDRAYVAMSTLAATRSEYAEWLVGVDYLESRRRRITFVGSAEFGSDLQRFFQGLGVKRKIDVPREEALSQRVDRDLSRSAQRNLRKWYADDVAIFTWARRHSEPRTAPDESGAKPGMPRNDDSLVLDLYAGRPYVHAYRDHMNLRIRSDPHAAIGGKWEEMGQVQMEFLTARGLATHHRLLDVGCGTLRAGRHIIGYLDPGNYVGFDLSDEAVAYSRQLVIDEGLVERDPTLFVTSGDLTFAELAGQRFDFLLAQSVFTHLPPEAIEECLAHVGDVLSDTGRFFFTYSDAPAFKQTRVKGFRYPAKFFEDLAARHGFALQDWSTSYPHPRGQRMLELARR